MRIAEKMAKALVREVEVGGVHWRLRLLSSLDLMAAGEPILATVPVPEPHADPSPPAPSLREAQGHMRTIDRTVMAAVTHVSEDGTNWEELRLVENEADAKPADGVLWLEAIPPQTRAALLGEAMRMASDDGRLADALKTFRVGGSEPPAAG